MRPHHGEEQGRVFSGEPLQFALGQFRGIYRNAALTAAVGDVHHSALEGHGCSECLNFIHVHVLVIADAPFVGPSDAGVLHSVALEHFDGAIVHPHGHRYLQFPFRVLELDVVALFQPQQLGCLVHNVHDLLVWIVAVAHGRSVLSFKNTSGAPRL